MICWKGPFWSLDIHQNRLFTVALYVLSKVSAWHVFSRSMAWYYNIPVLFWRKSQA